MDNFGAYFETKAVGEGIWSISGLANDLMYLVTGREQALLVDTGMGIGDLAGLVKSLTDLPLTVVNTHGHPDHAGGNPNFGEIWLSPKDTSIMHEMCSDEYRINDIRAFNGEQNPLNQRLLDGLVRFKPYSIQPIKPGLVFDLGGRQFEVLEIPGHTPGSVCFLNSREKIMFCGDSVVQTPVWMYLKHSLPLQIYHAALKKIQERESEFEILLPGHHPYPLGREDLAGLITCTGEILARPGIGELTKTFAGEGLQWKHEKVSVIYNPANIC
jgi:hydroxyacylglutathione hydrolase